MNARSRRWVTAATLLLLGSLAACSNSSAGEASSSAGSTQSATSASPAPSTAGGGAAQAAAVGTATTALGAILVDGAGMTLYMFDKDSQGSGTSSCEGDCLAKWPPLLGQPTASAGVDSAKLGTISRSDGTTQATYNGWPLYYWAGDTAAGQTAGQGVGGVWWVLTPQGDPIR